MSGDGDFLGVKSYGEAAKEVVKKSLPSIGAYIDKICMPVAEEIGLLLKDKISFWRAQNAIKIIEKSKRLTEEKGIQGTIHPRLLNKIVDSSSWEEDDLVGSMWAGLLSSSIDKSPTKENLLFISILDNLTPNQCKIIDYVCRNCTVTKTEKGFLWAKNLIKSPDEIGKISGITNLHTLDRELDSLYAKGLIQSAIDLITNDANIAPRPLALQLFARCNGEKDDFFAFYEMQGNFLKEPEKQFREDQGHTLNPKFDG